MEFILLYFAIAWALAVVVGIALWKFGKPWPPFPRVLLASFGTALFAAPSIAVGHGVAPVPLPLQLLFEPEVFNRFIAIAFAVTWGLTSVIFLLVSVFTKPR